MSVLHILRTSGFSDTNFTQCFELLQKDDGIALIDDGCYNLAHPKWREVVSCLSLEQLYFIGTHAHARAIKNASEASNIGLTELNQLFFKFDTVMTWQ